MTRMITDFYKDKPDGTLRECQQYIRTSMQDNDARIPSIATIDRIVRKENLTWKVLSRVPAMRNDERTILKRKIYATRYMQMESQVNFVFVDEFGCHATLRRGRGRGEKGSRIFIDVQAIKGKNCTVCAAIDLNGVIHYQAQFLPMTSELFVEFLRELNEKLDKTKQNVLVYDNSSSHKTNEVTQFLKSANLKFMYCAPYSPMLNPIENCFSKVKNMVRGLNSDFGLDSAIEQAFSSVTAENCAAWFGHAKKYFAQCLTSRPINVEPEELELDEEVSMDWSSDDELLRTE